MTMLIRRWEVGVYGGRGEGAVWLRMEYKTVSGYCKWAALTILLAADGDFIEAADRGKSGGQAPH